MTIKKLARLTIAAGITAVASILFIYLTDPQSLYLIYRCAAGAKTPLDCYRGKPTAFKTTTFGMVYEGTTGDSIDLHVLGYGGYEKPQMFFLRDVSKGGVFLDIGAHKGLYSLFMSKYQKEIHAFEPYEPVLKKFRALIANNGIRNIVIHPVGLGDKHESLAFETPPDDNTMIGSFAFVSNDRPHEQLEIVSGDAALKEAGVKDVELIKMDIEGFEQPALKGLKDTLARSRPIVVFEITLSKFKPVLFKSVEQIYKAFPAGYKFLVFKNVDRYTGAYQLATLDGERLNFDGDYEQHDVIAFPAEKQDQIPLKGPLK
jgi:FkbM family methyltransferase